MNWNYLILIIPILCIILAFIGLIDIKKRKFPNGFVESIYLVLIVFPPAIGFAFYYYHVMRQNRYPRK